MTTSRADTEPPLLVRKTAAELYGGAPNAVVRHYTDTDRVGTAVVLLGLKTPDAETQIASPDTTAVMD